MKGEILKFQDSTGNVINNLIEWENYFLKSNSKKKHWKDGRSAKSIAEFMINKNGIQIITNVISKILSEKVTFSKAIPEFEVRFDNFGNGREHDLGLFGKTDSNKRVFVGVEAKVDESFNEKISDIYIKAKSKELNGESTNAPKRIEKLIQRNFNNITPDKFNLRYQLLYSTVGTLDAKIDGKKADVSILLIIIFQTNLYNKQKGSKNHKDYIQFIKAVNSKKIYNSQNVDLYKLKIDGKDIYSVYMNVGANYLPLT